MSFTVKTEIEINDLPEDMFDEIIKMLLNEVQISIYYDYIHLWLEPDYSKKIKILDLAKELVQSTHWPDDNKECLEEIEAVKHAFKQALEILDQFGTNLPEQRNAKTAQ